MNYLIFLIGMVIGSCVTVIALSLLIASREPDPKPPEPGKALIGRVRALDVGVED